MEPNTDDEDDELEGKVSRILEMFPQLTRIQLLDVSLFHQPHRDNFCSAVLYILLYFQVIQSTATLEGAVAACLLKYGDKEGEFGLI